MAASHAMIRQASTTTFDDIPESPVITLVRKTARENVKWLASLRIPEFSEEAQENITVFLYSLVSLLFPDHPPRELMKEQGNPDNTRLRYVKVKFQNVGVSGPDHWTPLLDLVKFGPDGVADPAGIEALDVILCNIRVFLTPDRAFHAELEEDLAARQRNCDHWFSQLEALSHECDQYLVLFQELAKTLPKEALDPSSNFLKDLEGIGGWNFFAYMRTKAAEAPRRDSGRPRTPSPPPIVKSELPAAHQMRTAQSGMLRIPGGNRRPPT
jgi:hypothetical protein